LGNEQTYLDCDAFSGRVDNVARDLLGRTLRVCRDGSCTNVLILETEAYGGPDDLASHAAFKPRGGARLMWEQPGTIYVFSAYGMYPCLNVVTGAQGEPSAVLFRGGWIDGASSPTLGPGRLGRMLGVTLDDNGLTCCSATFQVSVARRHVEIHETPRIGISRAAETLWRFVASLD
jgi:DNA-3-methyladenine glycosylase